MRNTWNHLAVVLYSVGIILLCLFFVHLQSDKAELPTDFPQPAFTATAVPRVMETPTIPTDISSHQPERIVTHQYTFDTLNAEPVPAKAGMLTVRNITESRYFSEPTESFEHVYREENGLYDCFIYGIGTVGDLDAYAKYIFRYDSRTGKAASFVQEQYIDTGEDMSSDHLAVYAVNTGNLLEALFAGMDLSLDTDKRVIEELALYFFSSYIPQNPSIPAVLHFRMPAYVLTFVMDTDVFITIISPDKLPAEYVVENETD